jgi:hypothetical protein
MTTLAFGGGLLAGEKLVRFAYLDEAGISNPSQEPFAVVAGVIINADAQWREVEQRLKKIADKYAPQDKRNGFVFHAKDIFHGDRIFARNLCPDKEQRWAILDELCKLPHEFSLPVVAGFVDRRERRIDVSNADAAILDQTKAGIIATLAVERYMRDVVSQDEVASIVYENNDQCRRLVRGMHNLLREPTQEMLNADEQGAEWANVIPLQKVVDTAHFADKTDCSILQLADVCAFAIKRKLMGTSDCDRFYAPIDPQLILKPTEWPSQAAKSSLRE